MTGIKAACSCCQYVWNVLHLSRHSANARYHRSHHDGGHPLCPFAHRLPSHRRSPHGVVQLALRQASRRPLSPAHRGHRPGAVHGRSHGRHHRRPAVAGPGLGRRRGVPVLARRPSHRGGRTPPRRRQGLSLLLHPRRAGRNARAGEKIRPVHAVRRTMARPRPGGSAAGRRSGHPLQGAPGRGNRDPRPCPGRGQGGQRPTGRHGAAARRRHRHLHAGGGGGRPRHGNHPRHSRRRPSDQRLPPDPALPRAGVGAAGVRPHPLNPRARRGQAVETARGPGGGSVPGNGLSSRGAVQLSPAPGLEPRG